MPPLPALPPIEVATINEHRQKNALGELAHETAAVAGGVVTFSPGIDWINHATMLGFNTDVDEPDIDAFEAFLTERGATPKLEITTFATESFLASLAARHYTVEQMEHVLVRRLHPGEDPFATMTHPPAEGLEIIPTDPGDTQACRRHAILVMSGFMPQPIPEEHIEMGVRSIVHPRSAGFTALIDGEPVGACGMEVFEHQGRRAASLWGASVAEPFRGRGVQQAMLAHRMAHALDRGCELALIESKPGIATERNVARMGFTLGYARVCMAKKPPASETTKAP
ncbi:MAG: GNAT family N-acetyltransferase [Phycisphaerales bacterium JB054]